MRAAAIQLNANNDKARNLRVAERLVAEAAADGAELDRPAGEVEPARRAPRISPREPRTLESGPSLSAAREWAREHRVHLLAGSITERRADADRFSNTSCLLGPDGETIATYRKVHMFDVDVGGRQLPRVGRSSSPATSSSSPRRPGSRSGSASATTSASPSSTGSSRSAARAC